MNQYRRLNSLICEVKEEDFFWRPHQDKKYPVDSIHASTKKEHHEDSIGVLDGTQQDILNVKSEDYYDSYNGPFNSKEMNNEKYYDALILNEEVISNYIIQKYEQQIISNDLDDYVWDLERYRSNDDDNNFNYDDIVMTIWTPPNKKRGTPNWNGY